MFLSSGVGSVRRVFQVLLLGWNPALSVAQYDPIRDFCRRFGHQSAVVDNKLYIDGGFVDWKPLTATSQSYTSQSSHQILPSIFVMFLI
jgi:hypothetical protein